MKKALFSLVILFVSVFCAVTVYANDYTVSPYRDMIDNYDEATMLTSHSIKSQRTTL